MGGTSFNYGNFQNFKFGTKGRTDAQRGSITWVWSFLTAIQEEKTLGKEYDQNIDVKDKQVTVIGGGDTAMDCVRTPSERGREMLPGFTEEMAPNMAREVKREFYSNGEKKEGGPTFWGFLKGPRKGNYFLQRKIGAFRGVFTNGGQNPIWGNPFLPCGPKTGVFGEFSRGSGNFWCNAPRWGKIFRALGGFAPVSIWGFSANLGVFLSRMGAVSGDTESC